MGEYRTISKRVQAVRWNGDNKTEVAQFAGSSHMLRESTNPADSDEVRLEYFDIVDKDWIYVIKGRWIVRHDDGVVTLMEDEAFKSEYEPVVSCRGDGEGGAVPPKGRAIPRTHGQEVPTVVHSPEVLAANSERHDA